MVEKLGFVDFSCRWKGGRQANEEVFYTTVTWLIFQICVCGLDNILEALCNLKYVVCNTRGLQHLKKKKCVDGIICHVISVHYLCLRVLWTCDVQWLLIVIVFSFSEWLFELWAIEASLSKDIYRYCLVIKPIGYCILIKLQNAMSLTWQSRRLSKKSSLLYLEFVQRVNKDLTYMIDDSEDELIIFDRRLLLLRHLYPRIQKLHRSGITILAVKIARWLVNDIT